jgi:hypothetical protein
MQRLPKEVAPPAHTRPSRINSAQLRARIAQRREADVRWRAQCERFAGRIDEALLIAYPDGLEVLISPNTHPGQPSWRATPFEAGSPGPHVAYASAGEALAETLLSYRWHGEPRLGTEELGSRVAPAPAFRPRFA